MARCLMGAGADDNAGGWGQCLPSSYSYSAQWTHRGAIAHYEYLPHASRYELETLSITAGPLGYTRIRTLLRRDTRTLNSALSKPHFLKSEALSTFHMHNPKPQFLMNSHHHGLFEIRRGSRQTLTTLHQGFDEHAPAFSNIRSV